MSTQPSPCPHCRARVPIYAGTTLHTNGQPCIDPNSPLQLGGKKPCSVPHRNSLDSGARKG